METTMAPTIVTTEEGDNEEALRGEASPNGSPCKASQFSPSIVVTIVVFVVIKIASALASVWTVGEVGFGQKMTETDIEGERVEGFHDTGDFRSKNLKYSAI